MLEADRGRDRDARRAEQPSPQLTLSSLLDQGLELVVRRWLWRRDHLVIV